MKSKFIFFIVGLYLGSLLVGTQAFSWFRIQQMFHFESFHMYGVLLSAISTAALSLFLIKKQKLRSIHGNTIQLKSKTVDYKSNVIGGLVFGVGWSLSGACTAPLFILVGLESQVGIPLLIGAILGTLVYGKLEGRLNG